MRPTLLLLTALPACGGFSNALFEEDADFAAALPSADRHSISVDTAGGEEDRRVRCERVWMLCLTWDVRATYNAYLWTVLSMVDRVRELPPSDRGEDWRSWGPYEVARDKYVTATIVRDGGAFSWQFDGANGVDGEPAVLTWGDHFESRSVFHGVGTMVLDFDALASLGWDTLGGEARLAYDFRDGRQLGLVLDGITDSSDESGEVIDAEAWYAVSGGLGRFEYRAPLDVNDNGVDEDLSVVARWVRGGAGRADATVTGGDAEGWSWEVAQCWSRLGVLTYEADNLGFLPEVGGESQCPFTERAASQHDRFEGAPDDEEPDEEEPPRGP